MKTARTVSADVGQLALALHDLSWWLARFAPVQVGLDPLPASELAVLRAIFDEPGRSVSDVAAAISMQPSNVSAAVRSLLGRGLVEKCPAAEDRRVALLHPTSQALANRDAIDNAVAATVSEALSALPAETVDTLLDALPSVHALTNEVASRVSGRVKQADE